MAKIEKFNTINSIMEEGMIQSSKRSYLGYSGLGGKCMRKIWYDFRWVSTDEASRRMNRIWDRGHLEETRIVLDLARVGCHVTEQEFEVVGVTGHVRGHGDGKAVNVPTMDPAMVFLFEAKTMKHSSYIKYIKEGLQRYSSTYWQQIHSYMGHEKLPACLYVVTNKDNEERDYKIINFDKSQFEEGERIGFNIITAEEPPPKMPNASSTFFECKWCCHNKVCHKGEPVERNCRTCKHWDIEDGGNFSCYHKSSEKHTYYLSKKEQIDGCNEYELDTDAYGEQ